MNRSELVIVAIMLLSRNDFLNSIFELSDVATSNTNRVRRNAKAKELDAGFCMDTLLRFLGTWMKRDLQWHQHFTGERMGVAAFILARTAHKEIVGIPHQPTMLFQKGGIEFGKVEV